MIPITRCLSLIACVLCLSVSIRLAAQEEPVVLVVGDSLSAAYNMALDAAWPRLLEERLADAGTPHTVVNASITGDTTQGGLTRLPRLLERHQPAWVIIELGGNDGLRGLSLEVTRSNLESMIRQSQQAGARVLLTGIMLPPNYGQSYTEQFQALYGALAEQYGTLLVPFFMDGVALVEGMMQDDGIHPSVEAQPILLDNVWDVIGPEVTDPAE
jgi:acyl-CoA thioesterase-1